MLFFLTFFCYRLIKYSIQLRVRQLSVPGMSRNDSKRSSQISLQADQRSGSQQTGDYASPLSQALPSPTSDQLLQTKYRRPLYVQVGRRTHIIIGVLIDNQRLFL